MPSVIRIQRQNVSRDKQRRLWKDILAAISLANAQQSSQESIRRIMTENRERTI